METSTPEREPEVASPRRRSAKARALAGSVLGAVSLGFYLLDLHQNFPPGWPRFLGIVILAGGAGLILSSLLVVLTDFLGGAPEAVPWYGPDGWERLRRICDDPASLGDSYQTWRRRTEGVLDRLERFGIAVRKVEVDVPRLESWCLERGFPNSAHYRARYARETQGRSPGFQEIR